SVISDVDKAKNVKTVSGTVDNIISATNEKNGEVYKMLVVKDSDGKKHRFYKNNHLESIEANRKEDITVDYVKTDKQEQKNLDGDDMVDLTFRLDTKSKK